MRILVALVLALAGSACASFAMHPDGYVVTSVAQRGSTLVATKCPTYSGRVAYVDCHEEAVAPPVQASR